MTVDRLAEQLTVPRGSFGKVRFGVVDEVIDSTHVIVEGRPMTWSASASPIVGRVVAFVQSATPTVIAVIGGGSDSPWEYGESLTPGSAELRDAGDSAQGAGSVAEGQHAVAFADNQTAQGVAATSGMPMRLIESDTISGSVNREGTSDVDIYSYDVPHDGMVEIVGWIQLDWDTSTGGTDFCIKAQDNNTPRLLSDGLNGHETGGFGDPFGDASTTTGITGSYSTIDTHLPIRYYWFNNAAGTGYVDTVYFDLSQATGFPDPSDGPVSYEFTVLIFAPATEGTNQGQYSRVVLRDYSVGDESGALSVDLVWTNNALPYAASALVGFEARVVAVRQVTDDPAAAMDSATWQVNGMLRINYDASAELIGDLTVVRQSSDGAVDDMTVEPYLDTGDGTRIGLRCAAERVVQWQAVLKLLENPWGVE